TVDVYNPKVVQATMGSIARVNVHTLNIEEWINAQQNIPVLAAALDGKDIRLAGKPAEAIIIIGNEAKGISPAVMQLASEKITITGRGHAESLNAAVATGIILSHLT
ncbi:MAG: RNA methyltransferase, partial [Chitinophagaceae bacterium]|nr:RNA methyltransferase [Chitinophagaceae bacterium]